MLILVIKTVLNFIGVFLAIVVVPFSLFMACDLSYGCSGGVWQWPLLYIPLVIGVVVGIYHSYKKFKLNLKEKAPDYPTENRMGFWNTFFITFPVILVAAVLIGILFEGLEDIFAYLILGLPMSALVSVAISALIYIYKYGWFSGTWKRRILAIFLTIFLGASAVGVLLNVIFSFLVR